MQICEGGRLLRDDSLCDPTSFAQLTPKQRARMRAIGPCWNDDIVAHRAEMVALYSPLAASAPKAAKVVRDIAYGPDPRQVLDVFCPDGQEGARPVVVFIHGGAFTRGAKSANGEIYDNVLHWFARLGYVGVNVEYRLAPDIIWPDGARDALDVLAWVRDTIATHGGDPARVHVIGHSAGGSHLATAALEPGLGGLPAGVRSLALVSGRLRADRCPDNPNASNVAAYFGADESLYAARSPVSRAADCPLPVLVAVAEFENRHLDEYGAEFARAVARAGRVPVRWIRLAEHNHTSIVAHLNTGEEGFGRALDAFFRLNASVSDSERNRTGAL